ncbi:MAG: right-handed parallel beta-helix repeat-containing protein [Phycisphaerales bacterium]|nr:right-handed parallel beta-helix repeat-containing protein [Phycisphaerales bacterium]
MPHTRPDSDAHRPPHAAHDQQPEPPASATDAQAPLARSAAHQRRIAAAIAMMGASLALAPAAQAQGVIYVDDDAAPGGTGESWETALRTLHEAIDLAATRPHWDRTINIADGVYEAIPLGGTADDYLRPASGVTFRGGFGRILNSEPPEQWVRDPDRFVTVIDGRRGLQGEAYARYLVEPVPGTFSDYEDITFRFARDGAIRCLEATSVGVRGCRFAGFDVRESVILADGARSLWLEHCRIEDNLARYSVVGVYRSLDVHVRECTFARNIASLGAGGALDVFDTDLVGVTSCIFESNSANSTGGAVIVYDCGEVFVNFCRFDGNSSGRYGGALEIHSSGPARVNHCVFTANIADYEAGAIGIQGTYLEPARIENCLFIDNTAIQGGGAVAAREATIANCTFIGNHSGRDRAGAVTLESGSRLSNSILWANTVAQPGASLFLQQVNSNGRPVENNIIAGADDGMNLPDDPRFVAPGDYRLAPGSPAINLGDRGLVSSWPEIDLGGSPRFSGAFVDAGCYEAPQDTACGEADISASTTWGTPGYRIPDGRVDSTDLFTYLDAFARGNASADLTRTIVPFDPYYGVPDGIISATDFYYYLIKYEEGCR